jgi:hypothetical protein
VEPQLGGIYITDRLVELEKAIDDYYGMVNLLKAGITPKGDEIVDKPEALSLYDMCKEMGIPRVTGCLEEQPYIWLLEWATAKNKSELHEHLYLLSLQQNQAQQTSGAT